MSIFYINPEVSIGDVLTTTSIFISLVVLLISWNKDQNLKRKDYADKIRYSASLVVAKIERWKSLSSQFFDEIQPMIIDADMTWVDKKDILNVRDVFWREMVAARTKIFQKISDEEIEIAYTNLYGYDTKIQGLFDDAINRLKAIENYTHQKALYQTQIDIISIYAGKTAKTQSSILGNRLRDTCYKIRTERHEMMSEVISPFVVQLIKLIQENDKNILKKRIHIQDAHTVYSVSANEFKNLLDRRVVDELKSFQDAQEKGELTVQLMKLLQNVQLCAIDKMHEPYMGFNPRELLEIVKKTNNELE